MTARYAIYYAPAPQTPLWRLGSSILGRDAASGEACAFPAHPFFDQQWTTRSAEPRRYGFHATMKAPFALASNVDEARLFVMFDTFCAGQASIAEAPLVVSALDRFAALVPARPAPAIEALAARVVDAFEPARAPLKPQQREKRLSSRLTPRQRVNLERYGYPHVLDDFRFHMTLTGPLEAGVALRAVETLSELLPAPRIVIDALCIFREAAPGEPFRIVRRTPLSG
jgi:hypothetical protein